MQTLDLVGCHCCLQLCVLALMDPWVASGLKTCIGSRSEQTTRAYEMVACRVLGALMVPPKSATRETLIAALCRATLGYQTSNTKTMARRMMTVGLRVVNAVWLEAYKHLNHAITPGEVRVWASANLGTAKADWLLTHGLQTSDRSPQKARYYFSSEETTAMRAACQSTRETLMLELLLTTGIRITALCSISWDNVHFTQRRAFVREKGGHHREIYMHDNLVLAFQQHLCNERRHSVYVFPSSNSPRGALKPLTARHMRNIFYTLADRANVQGPHAHPHACRHTVVHRLWSAGNSLDRISRFLGHASPATTGKYYMHLAHRELVSRMHIPWYTLKDCDAVLVHDSQPPGANAKNH